jgi:signal transduction histidine kinase
MSGKSPRVVSLDAAPPDIVDPDVLLQLLHELEERNAALEQVNVDLRHFAEVAAHDLRSPLTLVVGYVEQVRRTRAGVLDDDAQEWLDRALVAARGMADLVEAVLGHARSAGAELNATRVELDAVVATALARLERRIAETGARVNVDPLPAVRGDHDLLVLVMQNLVDNALTYATGEPVVHVSARRDEEPGPLEAVPSTIVSVRDEGVGIPMTDRERVFALFGRGETGRSGHGIGLATAARVVARHGGAIWVADAPGPGTTIELRLPLAGS